MQDRADLPSVRYPSNRRCLPMCGQLVKSQDNHGVRLQRFHRQCTHFFAALWCAQNLRYSD
jgi:hypothetical protein